MNYPGPGMMPFSQQQYTPQQSPFGQAMGRGMQQPQFGMQQPQQFGMQQPQFGGGFGMQQPSFGGGFGMQQPSFGGFGGGFGMQPPQFGGGFGMQQPGFGFGMQPGFGGGFGMQPPQFGGGFGMGMGGFPSQRFPGLQVSGPSPFQFGGRFGGGFGGGFGMPQPRPQPYMGGFPQPMPPTRRPRPDGPLRRGGFPQPMPPDPRGRPGYEDNVPLPVPSRPGSEYGPPKGPISWHPEGHDPNNPPPGMDDFFKELRSTGGLGGGQQPYTPLNNREMRIGPPVRPGGSNSLKDMLGAKQFEADRVAQIASYRREPGDGQLSQAGGLERRGLIQEPPMDRLTGRPMDRLMQQPVSVSPLLQSFNREISSPQYQGLLQRYQQSRGQDQGALGQLQAIQERMQQQQNAMPPMPRAITGREQLMRRRDPLYQGPF